MEKQPLDKTISIFGCGWLGLPLGRLLVKQGFEVIGTTTSKNKFEDLIAAGIAPILYQLGDLQLHVSLTQSKTAIVAIPSKNVLHFNALLRQIAASAIEKVIFISSTSVYRDNKGEVNECSPLNEGDLVKIESLFQNSNDFQCTIIRFAGLIGPKRHPGRFFKNKPIPNPNGPVNMIHLEDCLSIIYAVLKQEAWGEVFNAVADSHPSRKEFYSLARESLGVNPAHFVEIQQNEYGKIITAQKLKSQLHYSFVYADPLEAIKHCD